MTNKQETVNIMTTVKPINVIDFHHTPVVLPQYLIYNCFSIRRPIRPKYKLTINEIIILNGMMIYHKLIGSSFSENIVVRFVGYFNSNKVKYYIGSLLSKECIEIADINYNKVRYKLSNKGIEIVSCIDELYNSSLSSFISSYSLKD